MQLKTMAPALGIREEVAYAAFSCDLLVSALAAAPVGRLLDRYGGRSVMAAGSLVMATAFFLFASAQGAWTFWCASLLMGVGMSLTLYEAAFATIVQATGKEAKRHITMVTLAGGFASTVFWPGTSYINGSLGWSDTYLILGALQLVVCLPAHAGLPRYAARPQAAISRTAGHTNVSWRSPQLWLLGAAFSSASLISSGISLHLPGVLAALGHSSEDTIWLAALLGPFQVLGRVAEFVAAGKISAERWALAITAAIPVALIVLLAGDRSITGLVLFVAIYGISNGLMTIVRGTLPLELFGADQYGQTSGMLAAPSLFCKALGPFALAAAISHFTEIGTVIAIVLALAVIAPACIAAAITWSRRSPA